MDRLTREIKSANNYCGYELKDAPYKKLFDLKSNREIEDYVDCDLTLAIDKLGEIEDLLQSYNVKDLKELDKLLEMAAAYEELSKQLGCPLEVVLKALKQPIYSTHPKTNKLCCIICPTFYFSGNQWLIGCHSMEWNTEEMGCDSWGCFSKDYKKTWWLKKDKSE